MYILLYVSIYCATRVLTLEALQCVVLIMILNVTVIRNTCACAVTLTQHSWNASSPIKSLGRNSLLYLSVCLYNTLTA